MGVGRRSSRYGFRSYDRVALKDNHRVVKSGLGKRRILEIIVHLSRCGGVLGQKTYRVHNATKTVGATKLVDTKAGHTGDFRIWDYGIVDKGWFQTKEGGGVFLCIGLGASIGNDELNDGLEQKKRKNRG